MPATNDTPLKRFTAFWLVLGAFLLFGIIALILAPLANTSEVTAADEEGAKRRLAIRETVDAEQAKNLSRSEAGDKLQVPPAEIFSFVGAKLASAKPKVMKNDLYRDPATVQAEAADASGDAAAPESGEPAAEENPTNSEASSEETSSDSVDPSAL